MTPFELAVQYHVDCELYDRTVCTGGMGKDGVLPANRTEQQKIEAHALDKRSFYAKKAKMLSVDFDEIIRDNRVIDEAIRVVSAQLEKGSE